MDEMKKITDGEIAEEQKIKKRQYLNIYHKVHSEALQEVVLITSQEKFTTVDFIKQVDKLGLNKKTLASVNKLKRF